MVALIAGAPQDPLATQFSVTPGSLGPLDKTSGCLQGRDEVTQIGYQGGQKNNFPAGDTESRLCYIGWWL